MNATTFPTSAGSPPRPSGTVAPRCARAASFCAWNCSVIIAPGPTAFTRMPKGARSSAVARVNASRPPFDASYAAMLRCARAAANEVMFTMAPALPCATMSFAARFVQRNRLRRFARITASQCATSISRKCTVGSDHAALFTRTSTVPNARTVSSKRRSTAASSPRSAATAMAFPPPLAISSTIGARRPPSVLPCTTTCAPSAARTSAVALPMPRLDPVTIATLFLRRMRGRASCGGGGDGEPVEDRAQLGALAGGEIGERWTDAAGRMTEQLHRHLHDRDLVATPALPEFIERTHDAAMVGRKALVIAFLREPVQLERGFRPEARERRGEALRPDGEVRCDQ